MGLFNKIKSVFSKKTDTEQVEWEPQQKIFSIPMGHSDYTDIMIEAMCCPYSEGLENKEITRLLRLAAKTKNKRIKRKLYKRIEREEQKNEI